MDYYRQALNFHIEVGDQIGARISLFNIATILAVQGDYAEAIRLFEQVVEIDQSLGHAELEENKESLELVREKFRINEQNSGKNESNTNAE